MDQLNNRRFIDEIRCFGPRKQKPQLDWAYISDLRLLLERARERGERITAEMIEIAISNALKAPHTQLPTPKP